MYPQSQRTAVFGFTVLQLGHSRMLPDSGLLPNIWANPWCRGNLWNANVPRTALIKHTVKKKATTGFLGPTVVHMSIRSAKYKQRAAIAAVRESLCIPQAITANA